MDANVIKSAQNHQKSIVFYLMLTQNCRFVFLGIFLVLKPLAFLIFVVNLNGNKKMNSKFISGNRKKNMGSKEIKIITIGLSLLIFCVSLTQNAQIVNYNDEIRVSSSLDYFLAGGFAFIGGGLFETIIWLANPLSLFAIKYFRKNDPDAVWLSLLASGLVISFSFWKEVLGAESGAMAKIISFELGYYLWLSSILVLTIGILINHRITLKESLQS